MKSFLKKKCLYIVQSVESNINNDAKTCVLRCPSRAPSRCLCDLARMSSTQTFVAQGHSPLTPTSTPTLTQSVWPLVPRVGFRPDVTVYTDGGCRQINKQRVASIGVYFGPNDLRNVSARVDPTGSQTNNVGELTAILKALWLLKSELNTGERVLVGTDSKYAILCATTYGDKCAPKKFHNVPNKRLVQALYSVVVSAKKRVQFVHIRAHTSGSDVHSIGNRAADALATAALQ
jgi:ribonuclease HI